MHSEHAPCFSSIRLGDTELASNLWLAPMAGYTASPFRVLLRRLGGLGLASTELVNTRSLVEENPRALKLLDRITGDRPLAVQLFGGDPEYFKPAAQMVESMGYEFVEINMGCSVRKVCRVGAGAALLADVNRATKIVQATTSAVKIPVIVKMRLGWDKQCITAPTLVRVFEDLGVKAVIVHGRTADQGFSGTVDLDGIRQVVQAARSIPVIGNGDVTTPLCALEMIRRTGCRGVSIGRGAFYDPWIFKRTALFLQTGELLPEPSLEDRLRFMCQHLDLMIEFFGEAVACRMFRKVAALYSRGFGPAKFFRQRVSLISTRADFLAVVEEYRKWRDHQPPSDKNVSGNDSSLESEPDENF